jgi:hypothetical protein
MGKAIIDIRESGIWEWGNRTRMTRIGRIGVDRDIKCGFAMDFEKTIRRRV